MIAWADTIAVMERAQLARLRAGFGPLLAGKRVVCLGIPDRYRYMEPSLVDLLERKMAPLLQSERGGSGTC